VETGYKKEVPVYFKQLLRKYREERGAQLENSQSLDLDLNPDFHEQEAEGLTMTYGGVQRSCLSEKTCDTLLLNFLVLRVYVTLIG